MGTQELPCFVRLKKSPVFLQQLTGLYCETGKNSDDLASECHIQGQQTLPYAPCAEFKGNLTRRTQIRARPF